MGHFHHSLSCCSIKKKINCHSFDSQNYPNIDCSVRVDGVESLSNIRGEVDDRLESLWRGWNYILELLLGGAG